MVNCSSASCRSRYYIAQQVEQALLTIPADDPTLKSIGIEEFVPAVSYSKLETLIEELQLKTWDVP